MSTLQREVSFAYSLLYTDIIFKTLSLTHYYRQKKGRAHWTNSSNLNVGKVLMFNKENICTMNTIGNTQSSKCNVLSILVLSIYLYIDLYIDLCIDLYIDICTQYYALVYILVCSNGGRKGLRRALEFFTLPPPSLVRLMRQCPSSLSQSFINSSVTSVVH